MKKVFSLLVAAVAAAGIISIVPCPGDTVAEAAVYQAFKADYNTEAEVEGKDNPTQNTGVYPWQSNHSGGAKGGSSVTAACENGYPYKSSAERPMGYSIEYGVGGKDATDGALKMHSIGIESGQAYCVPVVGRDGTEIFDNNKFPDIIGLERFSESRMTSQFGTDFQTKVSFDIMKDDEATEFYIKARYRATTGTDRPYLHYLFGINEKRDFVFLWHSTGVKAEMGKWYHIDIVFSNGKNTADLYIDGELAAIEQPFRENSSGDATNMAAFKCLHYLQMHISEQTNPRTDWGKVYIDNYEINLLTNSSPDSTERFTKFKEDFNLFKGSDIKNPLDHFKWITSVNVPSEEGYFVLAERGMFGRDYDDISACLSVEEARGNQTQPNPYLSVANAGMRGWNEGDMVRFGMDIAFADTDFMPWYSSISILPTTDKGDVGIYEDENNKNPLGDFIIIESNVIIFNLKGEVPYMYTMNFRAYKESEPIIMPLYYRCKDNRAYTYNRNEYYFGTEMIVSPITQKSDSVTQMAYTNTYLPEGEWFDFFTGRIYRGNRCHKMYRDIYTIPVFVKAGGIIPMSKLDGINDISNPQNLEIQVFPGADNSFTLYEDDGTTMEYEQSIYAQTEFNLSWTENKCQFTIKKPIGDNSIIIKDRTYTIVFRNISECSRLSITENGTDKEYKKYVKDNCLYIETESVNGEIKISFYADIIENDIKNDIFKILLNAQCDNVIKEQIYKLLDESDGIADFIGGINAIDIDSQLFNALVEIVCAKR